MYDVHKEKRTHICLAVVDFINQIIWGAIAVIILFYSPSNVMKNHLYLTMLGLLFLESKIITHLQICHIVGMKFN